MTTGQSGAKAPDRNRGRTPPGPPRRWAAYINLSRHKKPHQPREQTNATGELAPYTRAGNTTPDASPNPTLGYPAFSQAARMIT